MVDYKICRICLCTKVKMYEYDRYQLKYYYEEVMGIKVEESDNLPKYYCYECATMLHKFHKFKEKCYIGQKTLKQLLWNGSVTYESIDKINRDSINLQSPLTIMKITKFVEKYVRQDDVNVESIESSDSIDNFICDQRIIKEEYPNESISPKILYVDIKNEAVNSVPRKDRRKKSGAKSILDSRHWRTITLTEEEAMNEFRSKSTSKQYLRAAFKCQHCFRAFSKEEMLKRHTILRHSEAAGAVECHFCRMHFRYKSFLRKHLSQHYVRYECMRCSRICPFETSAIMHEEFHNGTTMKCGYCNIEFRHKSTYYSHVRTHRSAFVCAACGAAFVSPRGLHNHAKIKHALPYLHSESNEDDDETSAFCETCRIRFKTRKAYEEHLFQSTMHSDGTGGGADVECSVPRKISRKKEKAKITNELRKRKDDWSPLISLTSKRKKRQKRSRRKPTTCHQCGLHFESQSACMRHHVAAHPRTSFFPPNTRHICELCGASLAPGSVAVHRNMHVRTRVHPCATCGRQFHSAVGLRRHLITHTGEKPYGCPLCEKRFTQSNSMKLHYRTFHLKQPYPKRNRKKTKEGQRVTPSLGVSHSEPDSDCLRDADMNSLPDPPGIEPVSDAVQNHLLTDEPIHYMPL